ncbi:MAG: NYN domain-containing protein [Spirochaetales bacterium]|nr:NYN domain-containing protein [Spirochaetales bacterium]
MNKKLFIAFYIDLENIEKDIQLKNLMYNIKLRYDSTNQEPIFAYKIACGHSNSITKYRDQLKELNFDIRETPHIVKKKNRADLIISLDAFEKFYINNPEVSLFVFMTNDSDYSVIMDMLRKYGRNVWLVTNEEDSRRDIFRNCCDNIMLIEEYKGSAIQEKKQELFNDIKSDKDIRTLKAMLYVLKSLTNDNPYDVVFINNQFRKIENSIKLKYTIFKSFDKLYEYLDDKGVLKYTVIKGDKNIVSDINFDLI